MGQFSWLAESCRPTLQLVADRLNRLGDVSLRLPTNGFPVTGLFYTSAARVARVIKGDYPRLSDEGHQPLAAYRRSGAHADRLAVLPRQWAIRECRLLGSLARLAVRSALCRVGQEEGVVICCGDQNCYPPTCASNSASAKIEHTMIRIRLYLVKLDSSFMVCSPYEFCAGAQPLTFSFRLVIDTAKIVQDQEGREED
jgi:hypothetical protein